MSTKKEDEYRKKKKVWRNWERVKNDWIKSGLTLQQFAEKTNIPVATIYKRSKGWQDDKKSVEAEAKNETKKRLVDAVTEANLKHLGHSKLLQKWAIEHLMRVEVDKETGKEKIVFLIGSNKPDEVINALKTGIILERDVLGLNDEKPPIVNTNVLVMNTQEKADLEKDVKELITYVEQKKKLEEAIRIKRAKRIN